MEGRVFRERTLPLDGGIEVLIAGDNTPEDEVFIEYKSDSLVIYTGDRAKAMRAKPRTVTEVTAQAMKAAPRKLAAVPREDPYNDPDYVPPPVVPRPGDRRPAPSPRPQPVEATVEALDDENDEEREAREARAAEREVIRQEREEERRFAADAAEPLPSLRTSTAPRSPIDRTSAQRNALKIDTTMQTSMGETRVQADLSGMLRNG